MSAIETMKKRFPEWALETHHEWWATRGKIRESLTNQDIFRIFKVPKGIISVFDTIVWDIQDRPQRDYGV